ncbi:MAG: hypothetical protein B6I26_07355 [Desulfobacteraceae bacterium 4572_130]|nr:MAG: hypothetical protein B6I26_07355 [Desulfobacteraceae bacterium 4572_130]
MRIIEKIEIKSFRSFGNRKKNKTQITKIKDLNVFSGANDSGKSNILRALNLFFNKRTNLEDFLNFSNDFFRRANPDKNDVKEEQITIKITFWNKKNQGVNIKNESYTRLPERFWVSRKWLKNSEFSAFKQVDGVDTSFKGEKKNNWKEFYEEDQKTLKSNFRANLSKQLTDFLDSIQYHYILAIKDKSYFSHLYGELQQTLLKEEDSNLNRNKISFQDAIQKSTKDLMVEFKKVVNNENINITAAFELPDLINLFRTLNVQTGNVDLQYRGDGIQAKLIPEILNFIALKELQIKPSRIKKGEKTKKYFIWGFEEPENSYEYKNAQLLADRFKNEFINNAHVFLTTHSFNFLSIAGNNVSTYRVWRDEKIESSRITKIKQDNNGRFLFEGNQFKDDFDRLNEELGVFQLNKNLESLFIEAQEAKKHFLEKIQKIERPIIYTEGNNVEYIRKAKEFFAPDVNIDIESLGGKIDIKKFFRRFADANFSRFKILFVFDCDAKSEFQTCKKRKTSNLIPFIFEQNSSNEITEIQRGIENLFNEELFEDEKRFFSITETNRDGIIRSRKKELRKKDFCKFICEERDQETDFANFEPLFNIINDFNY